MYIAYYQVHIASSFSLQAEKFLAKISIIAEIIIILLFISLNYFTVTRLLSIVN